MRLQKRLGCGFEGETVAGLMFRPLPDLRGRVRPRSKLPPLKKLHFLSHLLRSGVPRFGTLSDQLTVCV